MSKFWIIAKDVYKKNVKSVAFLIMIIVPFILMGIFYLAGSFASNFSNVQTIGIVSDNAEIAKQMDGMKTDDFTFKTVASEDKAKKQLKDEKIDAFIDLSVKDNQLNAKLYMQTTLGSMTELVVNQVLNSVQSSLNASQLNITPEQLASLSQPANFSKVKVNFDEDGNMQEGEDHTGFQTILAAAFTILLFVIIVTYSSIIAQEIASEKGTRIMEVILSSTRAQTHFYGKLVGVIMVALTQLVLYILSFGIGYSQVKDMAMVKEFMTNIPTEQVFGKVLWFTLAFFLLGILGYCALAALCGSLVSKSEDAPKAVQPIMYFAMIGYMVGLIIGLGDPQNIIVKITSFIPLISSIVMPVRLATDTVTISEVIISLVVYAVFVVALVSFSAKLYKSNVLVYSEGGVLKSLQQSISILKNERKKA